RLEAWRSRLDRHALSLQAVPRRIAETQTRGRDRLTGLDRRADIALTQMLGQRRRGLDAQARMLQSLSYHSVLGRGFAVIRDADRTVLSRVAQVDAGSLLAIEFADGEIAALAQSTGQPVAAQKKPSRAKRGEPGQGSLF
ncbi:exodeoxyribonuclease VII large subunit, partial [Hoeflea sp. BAL378]|uniref:exodeoxyribonuclease VII large subunit n=1 Tax=Hoeflea sp. BAL378 TaxID=1547437 RepID=UPI00051338D4